MFTAKLTNIKEKTSTGGEVSFTQGAHFLMTFGFSIRNGEIDLLYPPVSDDSIF